MGITSFKGMLVNKLSTARLIMKWSGQKLCRNFVETLSANKKEPFTEDSLTVRGDKIELSTCSDG